GECWAYCPSLCNFLPRRNQQALALRGRTAHREQHRQAARSPKAIGLSAGKWAAHKIWPPQLGGGRAARAKHEVKRVAYTYYLPNLTNSRLSSINDHSESRGTGLEIDAATTRDRPERPPAPAC